jgi:hypothetical protein
MAVTLLVFPPFSQIVYSHRTRSILRAHSISHRSGFSKRFRLHRPRYSRLLHSSRCIPYSWLPNHRHKVRRMCGSFALRQNSMRYLILCVAEIQQDSPDACGRHLVATTTVTLPADITYQRRLYGRRGSPSAVIDQP